MGKCVSLRDFGHENILSSHVSGERSQRSID